MNNIFVEFLPPWVETGIQPAFYDKESGTVLQQTARMYARVNMLIRMFNKLSKETKETVEEYITKFNELHDYVHDYFDNLDVQEEINNKLDDMVEAGTLQEIITDYIQANVAWTFNTVAEMKSATNLVAGSYAQTLGYHAKNDGGEAIYYITDSGSADERAVIAVGSLYANLVTNKEPLNVKQFGAYGDGSHDDYSAIQASINYVKGNINKVHVPEGTYNVSKALILPQYMVLEGANRENTIIYKNANETDNDFSVDSIIIFEQTDDFMFAYNYGQTVKSLTLRGNNSNTYGIYAEKQAPKTLVENCFIDHVITCIYYKKGGWLFGIKNCSIQPVTNGVWINDTSTTLELDKTYVYGGNGYGYYLRGVIYSSLNNVACDANTNIAYHIAYANVVFNGIGCECPDNKKYLEVDNSKVIINSGTVIMNDSDATYIAVEGVSCDLTLNDVDFAGKNGSVTSIAGKFLNCRTDCFAEFNNCKCSIPFLTDNAYASQYSTQKITDKTSEVIVNGMNDQSGLGKLTNYDNDNFAKNTKLLKQGGAIIFNNRGDIRYSLDGFDRRWRASHNLGDIYINQAPALNGIAMFQQTSDSQTRNFTGTISAVNISGTTGTITLTTLELDVDSWGIKAETYHNIESSSGGTARISAVDSGTSTLTLTNISGNFNIGDTLLYKGLTNIDSTTTAKIQSIGYGSTSQRPANPVNGYMYWDTTLGKPIWRSGGSWKDATGTTV